MGHLPRPKSETPRFLALASAAPRANAIVFIVDSTTDAADAKTGVDTAVCSAKVHPDVVGMMGNLLLVTKELNDELANKAFSEKMRILSKIDTPLDDSLSVSPALKR